MTEKIDITQVQAEEIISRNFLQMCKLCGSSWICPVGKLKKENEEAVIMPLPDKMPSCYIEGGKIMVLFENISKSNPELTDNGLEILDGIVTRLHNNYYHRG